MPSTLTPQDLDQIERRGVLPANIERQLAILENPSPPVRLVRPCTSGDGIKRLSSAPLSEADWRQLITHDTLVKFVPASGAASRMFAFLPTKRGSKTATLLDLRAQAEAGERDAALTVELLHNIESFPFYRDLDRIVRDRTGSSCRQMSENDPGLVLELLADGTGLALASSAKGLLPFHRYDAIVRTAFEEHVVEGRGYVRDGFGTARFHFTVSSDQTDMFRQHADDVTARLGTADDTTLDIGFSVQGPETDTISVFLDRRPVRDRDGQLLFRPGGHGSLLGNLGRLANDGRSLVFIKNIDNVGVEGLHRQAVDWKRRLARHAIELRAQAFELLARLEKRSLDGEALADALAFVETQLAASCRPDLAGLPVDQRAAFLRNRLDRPLRVCGVVVNRGEPGGGPFWVRRGDGVIDGQIVEGAQIDHNDAEQREIWSSSSHFNPVDIVCSLTDRQGRPYDLQRFVDSSTYFVSTKTLGNAEIKVLERPGLWNGAMAGWNTAFVEVPESTFAPVKNLLDLLRPAHQT